MICNAGRSGYIKRTSLCAMFEKSAGTRMHSIVKDLKVMTPVGVASDSATLLRRTRHIPIKVNGNAVIRRSGYP